MKKIVSAILVVAAVLTACATQYSKLAVIHTAKELGKWDNLKYWISSAGLSDEFQNAVYLSDEYPLFPVITNQLVSSGILTSEDISTIMSASVDTAIPDASIRRVYETDMSNTTGRVRWHGKVVETVIDTNALTRTRIHADGWRFVEHFKTVNAIPVTERLSAAELANFRKEQAARTKAANEAKKAARIAALETNMVALATALAKQKQYPYKLAEMLLQNELNKLVGTNVVDAVITP